MKILFITSYSTGQGHISITDALRKQILSSEPDANISIIDGFAIGNWVARTSGRVYNSLALYCPYIWELIYRLSDFFPALTNRLTAVCVKKNMIKNINEIKPDLIVSVHAAFVGSMLNLLQSEQLSIPLISVVADLDNVTKLWSDDRIFAVLCPTEEAKKTLLNAGTPENKIHVMGFPVREEFSIDIEYKKERNESEPLKTLLISGSQGSRRIPRIVKALLSNKVCRMKIITGRNKLLQKKLELHHADQLGNEIEVMGFTKEINKYMREADIIIARASPNVLMEAIQLRKPVIITESFYGQEKLNPRFVEKYRLGVVCKKITRLPSVISDLSSKNVIREIQNNQEVFCKGNAAKLSAEFILSATRAVKNKLKSKEL